MNIADPQRVLQWEGAAHGDAFGPSRSVHSLGGEGIEIVVGPEQVALVIEADEVYTVLGEGTHLACVLREGEKPGEVGDQELARRMGLGRAELVATRRRVRMLESDWRIIHLSVAALPAIELSNGSPVAFEDRDHGTVEIEIDGACRLQVINPVRFYGAFLRNTEELSCHQFERICEALVQGGIARALDDVFESVDAIERDHRRLGAVIADHLQPSLSHVGLAMEQIEFTRLQTPVGLALAENRAGVPSLASVGRRQ